MVRCKGILAATVSVLGLLTGAGFAQTSDAAAKCREIAGAPDAGAPVSREALNAHFGKLGTARPHCEAAVIGATPDEAALFHLAVIMQREGVHERALEVFARAAESGLASAHTKLGDYYNFGIGPVQENHERAVAEYEKAIAGGDVPAMSTMAIMYQLGRGVTQDFEKSIELLEASAEAGYHFSQFRLAEIYMNPQSIPGSLARQMGLPDPVSAAKLYESAAAQGSQDARAALEKFMAGDGVFDSPEARAKWLEHASGNGNAQAMNALGLMHEQGNGVAYDPARAAELYVAALETGDLDVSSLRASGPRRWDKDTAVEFQILLQERGLYDGALDGIIGGGTLGAARRLAP